MDVERQLGIRERPEGVVGPTRLKAVRPTRRAVRNARGGSGGGTTVGSSGDDGRIIGFHGGNGWNGVGVGKMVAAGAAHEAERWDRLIPGREDSRLPRGARRRRGVVLRCDRFQSAAELRGRLPACPKGLGRRAPRPIGRFRSLGAGRFLLRPPSMAGMGWLGATSRKERPDAVRRGLQGVVIATARASAAGAVRQRTAVFWERTRASRSVFPEGALGSEKQKTHFRVEVGFGCVR